MKQGEIWGINFNPTQGSEQRGVRPGVIISGNAMNDHFGLVIVCPLTTRIKDYMGNLILLPDDQNGLKAKSEVLVFQIRTISKERIKTKLGTITKDQLKSIHKGLSDILTF